MKSPLLPRLRYWMPLLPGLPGETSRKLLTWLGVLAFSLALLFPPTARAELVVVTAARNGVEQLSREEVVNIFLGRYRRLPNGAGAVPIDHAAGYESRALFYRLLVGKEMSEINAYWAKLFFSGKVAPPLQAASMDELFRLLLNIPGSVAYMDRQQVDSRLRIVLDLAPSEH